MDEITALNVPLVCDPRVGRQFGFTLGFGFTSFTFATLSSFTFTFIFWTGSSACRFFPFLTFISSSSESDPESLTGLLTVMVFACVLFVWSHPYLRALQPAHAAPNSSTSQSLSPLSHRVQAFK